MHLFSLLTFLLLLAIAQSAKILFVSPNLSSSMVIYTGRMADVLQQAGHNVTFFIPEIRNNDQVNGTKLARVVRMKNLGDHFERHMQEQGELLKPRPTFWTRRNEMTVLGKICEQILIRRKELSWLKAEKFDLAIASNLDFCDLGIIKLLNIPLHIWTTTGPIHDITAWTIGIPAETSYVPNIWDNFMSPKMSLLDRMWNFGRIQGDRILAFENDKYITGLFRKYVRSDFPAMSQLASDSALLFVNGNEFVDPVRPLPSKAIQIGGVGLTQAPTLRGNAAKMAHKGEKGFVLFSLGTAVPTVILPEKKKRQIVEAFSHFPEYHFIIKADRDDQFFQNLTLRTTNVEVVSWVPQPSLLAHPNAKLFITHGGYNSILEGSLSGVPMLAIPLFFDQHHNAKTIEYREIGRALLPEELGLDALCREIRTVLNDPTYELNAKRIAKLARDKPNQPDETLINWVNFVLVNGPLPELTPELANLTFIQYYSLDIIGLIVATVFILFLSYKQAMSYLMSELRARSAQKSKTC